MSMTKMHLMEPVINSIYLSNVGTLVLRDIFLMRSHPSYPRRGLQASFCLNGSPQAGIVLRPIDNFFERSRLCGSSRYCLSE